MAIETEGKKPDVAMFAHVLYLAVGAVVVIIVAAVIIVSWRAHKKNTPPYTKHPTSQLHLPAGPASFAA